MKGKASMVGGAVLCTEARGCVCVLLKESGHSLVPCKKACLLRFFSDLTPPPLAAPSTSQQPRLTVTSVIVTDRMVQREREREEDRHLSRVMLGTPLVCYILYIHVSTAERQPGYVTRDRRCYRAGLF